MSEGKVNAEDFCKKIITGFQEKAKHNKNESMWCFRISMGGALLAPVFVTLGDEIASLFGEFESVFVCSKLIPSLLSVAVAFSTAWLQLRKPQQLWALYRTSQRELEDCLYKYQHNILEFSKSDNPEGLLVEKVSKIALDAHYSWLPIVPSPENLKLNSVQEEEV